MNVGRARRDRWTVACPLLTASPVDRAIEAEAPARAGECARADVARRAVSRRT
jgi:hypothetical protein